VNREQQEMALWRRVFERWYSRENYEVDTCGGIADAAVAEFRKRYPAEPEPPDPTAPEPTWYDVPPFAKDGKSHPCWVVGDAVHGDVYWCDETHEWWVWIVGCAYRRPLNGRRVSPIHKPPEPSQ
jgi:hypothetical protein